MIKLFRDVVRGLGYLPGYGEHPGLLWAALFPVFGAAAAGWRGAVGVALFTWPLVLIGAVDRARSYDRDQREQG